MKIILMFLLTMISVEGFSQYDFDTPLDSSKLIHFDHHANFQARPVFTVINSIPLHFGTLEDCCGLVSVTPLRFTKAIPNHPEPNSVEFNGSDTTFYLEGDSLSIIKMLWVQLQKTSEELNKKERQYDSDLQMLLKLNKKISSQMRNLKITSTK